MQGNPILLTLVYLLIIPNGKLDLNFFPFEACMKCLYIFMFKLKVKIQEYLLNSCCFIIGIRVIDL